MKIAFSQCLILIYIRNVGVSGTMGSHRQEVLLAREAFPCMHSIRVCLDCTNPSRLTRSAHPFREVKDWCSLPRPLRPGLVILPFLEINPQLYFDGEELFLTAYCQNEDLNIPLLIFPFSGHWEAIRLNHITNRELYSLTISHVNDLQVQLMEEIRTILTRACTFLHEVDDKTWDSRPCVVWLGWWAGPESPSFSSSRVTAMRGRREERQW